MNVGQKIHEIMAARGISSAEMARRLKISRQAVSQWASGSGPGTALLVRACRELEVSVDDVLQDVAAAAG